MQEKAIAAFKSLADVVGEPFAAIIRSEGPKLIDEKGFIQPLCPVVIASGRELCRDAALAYIRECMPKFTSQRIVLISEFPDEVPSDPSDDASMLAGLNSGSFYSFSPAQYQLPEISKKANESLGPQPATTKLAEAIREGMRWDTDLYCILSPMEMFAWNTLAQAVMTGHAGVVGIDRSSSDPMLQPKEGAFNMLPAQSFPVIDIDNKVLYPTLRGATVMQ